VVVVVPEAGKDLISLKIVGGELSGDFAVTLFGDGDR
jgi:hypothetical protein